MHPEDPEVLYARNLPGGGVVRIESVADGTEEAEARVVVERRSDPDRRDGHEAPVIAEERGGDKRSLLEKLVQLASDNVAIARGLQRLQRRNRE